VYSSTAVILVESQKIPENFVASTVQTALEAQLDTLKQQVLSTDRLWSLVERFHLYEAERTKYTREELLALMKRDITISLSRGWSAHGPGAFEVEFRAKSARAAAEVANQIGMFFINENLRQRTAEAAATSAFLDDQLSAAETRLREQEAKLKEFKLAHNGELPEQETALLATVAQGRTELLAIQESLGRAEQNKLILESSLAYAKASLRGRQERLRPPVPGAVEMEAAPAAAPAGPTPFEVAQVELGRLRARYHDSHPEVRRALAEVERLRPEEARRSTSGRDVPGPAQPTHSHPDQGAAAADESTQNENNRIQELTSQIAAITQEIETLEQRRQRVDSEALEGQARIQKLPVREQQLAVITRDYETSRNNYQSLLNKKLAADVAMDMERWHKSQKFIMLDPARTPERPARPNRPLLISTGSALSLLLGLALAMMLELRCNVLLGPWELPQGTPILGRIPILNASAHRATEGQQLCKG
jgi:polysaccharide chain length determinant protein (PEP-CTERM system associated)